MVRIRLRRVGGKKQPSFRIVAADKEEEINIVNAKQRNLTR